MYALAAKIHDINSSKIEALTSANLLTLDGIEVNVNQMQKRISRALTETENLGLAYMKERGILEENLQQVNYP